VKEMTYIKINDTLYPATINGRRVDTEWDNRESKAITLEMDYATASVLFVDGLAWSILQEHEEPIIDENGEQTGTETVTDEWDNSDYDIAGSITDNRNGTITVKMGKITDAEALAELMEVLA
jgi:hypothetical protein